jgi:uncharacterized protein
MGIIYGQNNRVVQKLQFMNNFFIKTAVLQAVGRKTVRLVQQPTGLLNKSNKEYDDWKQQIVNGSLFVILITQT